MHALRDLGPQPVIIAGSACAHPVSGLMPPIYRVHEMHGYEVAVKEFAVGDGELVEVVQWAQGKERRCRKMVNPSSWVARPAVDPRR